jgi:hypothetical protein
MVVLILHHINAILNDSTIAFAKGLHVNRPTIFWTNENKLNQKIYNKWKQTESKNLQIVIRKHKKENLCLGTLWRHVGVHNLGTRRRWQVSCTPRPLHPRSKPHRCHLIGGWGLGYCLFGTRGVIVENCFKTVAVQRCCVHLRWRLTRTRSKQFIGLWTDFSD